MLAILLVLFWVQSVIDQGLKQTVCVSYFTEWNQNVIIIYNIYVSTDVPSVLLLVV